MKRSKSKTDTFALICASTVLILGCFMLMGSVKHKPTSKSPATASIHIVGNGFQCSGEQIHSKSGADYILTAGHCHNLAIEGEVRVSTEDGRRLTRRVISEDLNSDLMLIEGVPGLQGLELAKAESMGEKVRTYTHGHGMDTYMTEGFLIQSKIVTVLMFEIADDASKSLCASMPKYKEASQESMFTESMPVCVEQTELIVSTANVMPGSSGGMVVNDSGKLVGVVSAGGDGFNYFVSLKDIHRFVDNY